MTQKEKEETPKSDDAAVWVSLAINPARALNGALISTVEAEK